MTKDEAIKAVRAYCENAWPCSSATRDGCWRKSWAESRLPNVGLNLFMELMANEGYQPRLFGENVWILRLPGPNERLAAGSIKCMGV